mgnify:CR=1 FL=1
MDELDARLRAMAKREVWALPAAYESAMDGLEEQIRQSTLDRPGKRRLGKRVLLLAAALAGFLANGYLLLCGRHDLPGGFCKISCAALITLACILGCSLLGTSASHAIIGSLMILTPGIAFTMGIRDFVQGDYLSGTIRMIDALLIAASIAIGTGLVLSLYTFFTGVVVA